MNKPKLCCLINPEYKCKCNFVVCAGCGDNPDGFDLFHECIKPLKPGKMFIFKGIEIKQGVGRYWWAGNLKGPNMKGWVPRSTSLPAKFLKVISLLGKAPRKMYYDSSQVSNLDINKAGYIVREGKGFILTEKGKEYLRAHNVRATLKSWKRGRNFKR